MPRLLLIAFCSVTFLWNILCTCILTFFIYNNSVRGAGQSYNPHFIDEDPDPREVSDLSKDTISMGWKSL